MSQQVSEKTHNSPVSLQDFVKDHEQQDLGTPWQLENSKTLEINLNNNSVFTKKGSMIAYYGEMKFERTTGTKDLGKMLKGFLTGEGVPIMSATGKGKLYVADGAKQICLVKLNGESISLNGNDILAYENTLQWDVELNKNLSSITALGLFSLKLSGNGNVAFTSHGKPLVLPVKPGSPLYTDPNATVCWSSSLSRTLKKDVSIKTFIGRASGESYQVCFEGEGFVVVQPYEEVYAVQS
jgi:uncharacterized protein (AIM24 family)